MTTLFLGWEEKEKVSRSKNKAYTDDWAFWFISALIKCLLGSLSGSSLGKVTDLCYGWVFPCCVRLGEIDVLRKLFGMQTPYSIWIPVMVVVESRVWTEPSGFKSRLYSLLSDTLSKLASVKLKFLSHGMETMIVLPHWVKDWMKIICVWGKHLEPNKCMESYLCVSLYKKILSSMLVLKVHRSLNRSNIKW